MLAAEAFEIIFKYLKVLRAFTYMLLNYTFLNESLTH